MDDYSEKAATLNGQVLDMERKKFELVHHVESRL